VPRAAHRAFPDFLFGFLKYLVLAALLAAADPAFCAEAILAARVWPAQEYTRVTLESAHAIREHHFSLDDPARLVVDLEGVELGPELKALASKVGGGDPYIREVRVGLNRPNVVRVVFDLRTEVKPSIFPLAPAGEYRNRLVIDLYPAKPADPLLALVAPKPDAIGEVARGAAAAKDATDVAKESAKDPSKDASKDAAAAKGAKADLGDVVALNVPRLDRLVIVAIDAGHGGEDPGAHGRGGTREKNVTLAIARRLKAMIDKEPDMRAVLTRDGDYFVPLAQRVAKARRMHADLFVSIHADAWVRRDARGSSVFALSERGATSAAARLLAQSENASDRIGGVDLGAQDPGARAHAPRPFADRDDQRLAQARTGGAERAGRRERPAQGARGAGGLRGAQGARHPVDPGRDRLHLESGRGEAAQGLGLPGKDRRRDPRRPQALPRAEPAARAPQPRVQRLKNGTHWKRGQITFSVGRGAGRRFR